MSYDQPPPYGGQPPSEGQPPYGNQPPYGGNPGTPQYGAAPASDPGRVLGIIGLITAIIPCTWWIGLILSIIGFVLSRRVGIKNNLALAGIIVAAVWLIISIILNATGVVARMMGG